MNVLEKTESICPTCYQEGNIKKIEANIIEEDNKVWIIKNCKNHGFFKEIYFGDIDLYNRWMKYRVDGAIVSDIKTSLFNNPSLYEAHTSQTILTNLVVTNRYNLECNYCNMDANASGIVYEPTLDELRRLMLQTRNEKPIGSKAIQITGGEPTLRDDLFEIIKTAKEVGFTHVQLHTNGLKLAENIEYCKRLKDEKIDSIYLSFNGITEGTNPLLKEHKKTVENLKKVDLKIVLIPVLLNDKNIHEAGKIIGFALDNIDIIKGINFQPISFCDKAANMKQDERKKQRVDYVKILESIEKEFNSVISRDDFYPISFNFSITKLTEMITKEQQVAYTLHPGCGGSTFIFYDEGKIKPITSFFDVERYVNFIDKQTKKKGPLKKIRIAVDYFKNVETFVDNEKAPPGFNLKHIMKDASIAGRKYALRHFHNKTKLLHF